jgi:hypothetical protein
MPAKSTNFPVGDAQQINNVYPLWGNFIRDALSIDMDALTGNLLAPVKTLAS